MSTEAINNLQNQNNPEKDPNFKKFFANFGVFTGVAIGFVVIGSIGLYMSKVAESGILPTDPLYKPYTCDVGPSTSSDFIKMNIVREFGMKGMAVLLGYKAINSYSQLAKFDEAGMEKSFKGGLIKSLFEAAREPKQKGTSNATPTKTVPNLSIWRSDVLNQMVASSFGFIQSIFKGFQQFPEWLTMLIFGLMGLIFIPFFIIYNLGVSFWFHFKTLANVGFSLTDGLKFLSPKTRGELGETGDDIPFPNVENRKENYLKQIPFLQYFKYFFMWIFVTIGLAIYFIGSMFMFSPLFLTFYPIIKTLGATYNLKIEDEFSSDENLKSGSKGLLSFIKDTFSYKRTYIIFLSIINLFTCSNAYLGLNYFIALIIAVIMAIIYCNILVATKSDGDNTLIKVIRKGGAGGDDADESDADESVKDDAEECADDDDATQQYIEQIESISKDISKKQGKTIDFLNEVYVNINNVKQKLNIVNTKDIPGIDVLQSDINNLVQQYFNDKDFGRQSLILNVTDDPINIKQKLRAQLLYLTLYNKALNSALQKCIDSLNKLLIDNNLTKINTNNNTTIPILDLMSLLSKIESLIYSVRPNIIEIEGKNPEPTQQQSMFSKIGAPKNKYTSLYSQAFSPVEKMIQKINSVILDKTDVLTNLLVDYNDPDNKKYEHTIGLFISKISDQFRKIESNEMFKLYINEFNGDGDGSDAGPDAGSETGPDTDSDSDSDSDSGSDSESDLNTDVNTDANTDVNTDVNTEVAIPTANTEEKLHNGGGKRSRPKHKKLEYNIRLV